MDEKNPYNIYYMSSIQIDKISGQIFFRYPANPVSGRIVKITIRCTPSQLRISDACETLYSLQQWRAGSSWGRLYKNVVSANYVFIQPAPFVS
jgi:hypothetical protein